MTEFRIYDAGTDEMVPLTQARLDELSAIAMLFGLYRSILRGLMAASPMKDGKANPDYKEMLRAMSGAADAFAAKTKTEK